MNRYEYVGPVMEFNNCVVNNWKAYTYAQSEKKALSNLAYRFKKANNRMPNAKISLPGEITIVY